MKTKPEINSDLLSQAISSTLQDSETQTEKWKNFFSLGYVEIPDDQWEMWCNCCIHEIGPARQKIQQKALEYLAYGIKSGGKDIKNRWEFAINHCFLKRPTQNPDWILECINEAPKTWKLRNTVYRSHLLFDFYPTVLNESNANSLEEKKAGLLFLKIIQLLERPKEEAHTLNTLIEIGIKSSSPVQNLYGFINEHVKDEYTTMDLKNIKKWHAIMPINSLKVFLAEKHLEKNLKKAHTQKSVDDKPGQKNPRRL